MAEVRHNVEVAAASKAQNPGGTPLDQWHDQHLPAQVAEAQRAEAADAQSKKEKGIFGKLMDRFRGPQ
jgi:hypothetical protein